MTILDSRLPRRPRHAARKAPPRSPSSAPGGSPDAPLLLDSQRRCCNRNTPAATHIDVQFASFAPRIARPSIGAQLNDPTTLDVQTILSRPEADTPAATGAADIAADAVATQADIAQLDAALRALLRRGGPELQARVEHRLVHVAYELCAHNQVRTARLLGITRNVLRTQLIRFGYLLQTGTRRAVRPPRA